MKKFNQHQKIILALSVPLVGLVYTLHLAHEVGKQGLKIKLSDPQAFYFRFSENWHIWASFFILVGIFELFLFKDAGK